MPAINIVGAATVGELAELALEQEQEQEQEQAADRGSAVRRCPFL